MDIPHFTHPFICFIDIWIVSNLWLLWTFVTRFCEGMCFHSTPRSGIAGSYGISMFNLWGTTWLFFKVAAPYCIPTNPVSTTSSPKHLLSSLFRVFFFFFPFPFSTKSAVAQVWSLAWKRLHATGTAKNKQTNKKPVAYAAGAAVKKKKKKKKKRREKKQEYGVYVRPRLSHTQN